MKKLIHLCGQYAGRGAVIALFAGFLMPASATELIVVDQPDCPFCERFEREIAPAWPNTDEGRAAPLRNVSLREEWPSDLEAVERPDFTPTFILVDKGQEIGRLSGYRGDEHFWFLIGQLLERKDDVAPTSQGAEPIVETER